MQRLHASNDQVCSILLAGKTNYQLLSCNLKCHGGIQWQKELKIFNQKSEIYNHLNRSSNKWAIIWLNILNTEQRVATQTTNWFESPSIFMGMEIKIIISSEWHMRVISVENKHITHKTARWTWLTGLRAPPKIWCNVRISETNFIEPLMQPARTWNRIHILA